MGYSQAFDGKDINWHSDEPWPHRMELAQALDWITELGAMVLNLADRVEKAEGPNDEVEPLAHLTRECIVWPAPTRAVLVSRSTMKTVPVDYAGVSLVVTFSHMSAGEHRFEVDSVHVCGPDYKPVGADIFPLLDNLYVVKGTVMMPVVADIIDHALEDTLNVS
jgi:hypothetical protein